MEPDEDLAQRIFGSDDDDDDEYMPAAASGELDEDDLRAQQILASKQVGRQRARVFARVRAYGCTARARLRWGWGYSQRLPIPGQRRASAEEEEGEGAHEAEAAAEGRQGEGIELGGRGGRRDRRGG
eukprot:751900-Prymnesium_polylepis.1